MKSGVMVLLALIGVSACSVAEPTAGGGNCPESLSSSVATVVVAFTASSAEPAPVLPPELRAQVRGRARRGEEVCVGVVSPQGALLAVDVTARRRNGQVENGPARGRRVEQNLARLDQVVAHLSASAPGLDPLRVLDAAARRHPAAGPLWLVTSGVATVAPTDLRRLGWDLDAQDQARRLAAEHALPDLRGRTVRFVGIGDVAGRQPSPGIALRQRLQEWWLDICRAGGAADCLVDRELLAGGSPFSRNTVPVVPLPRPVVEPHAITVPNALLFAIGRSDLGEGADEVLGRVVDRVLEKRETVRIEGHTDAVTGSARDNQRLSERRAHAVAERLVDLGLPSAAIVGVRGVGAARADAERERQSAGQVARDRNVEIVFLPGDAS